MTNTLFLPELREMLAERNEAELREFCTALHPARTAEFMEGLDAAESWEVLRHTDEFTRVQIFLYLELEKQLEILRTIDRREIAEFIGQLPPDERVDKLRDLDTEVVDELLPLVHAEERRDILRLRAYPEDTAGGMMTTDFARLPEDLTVREALDEIGQQAKRLETIYYLYVVDAEDHLRGLVTARALVRALSQPETKLADLMERAVVSVDVMDSREQVAEQVARYDLLAIPVVDHEHHMLGIVTHDDVIDVLREEAARDVQQIGGVTPLAKSYLETGLWTITWKRGLWLTVLFCGALITVYTLSSYQNTIGAVAWLVFFLPLVISTGGNSGNQSATLIITALTSGELETRDWLAVVRRELMSGLLLGGFLGLLSFLAASRMAPTLHQAMVIPLTLWLVVICGMLTGALLPLLFRRLGLDPALMSNPFVASIVDLLGIVIYMQLALNWLPAEVLRLTQ